MTIICSPGKDEKLRMREGVKSDLFFSCCIIICFVIVIIIVVIFFRVFIVWTAVSKTVQLYHLSSQNKSRSRRQAVWRMSLPKYTCIYVHTDGQTTRKHRPNTCGPIWRHSSLSRCRLRHNPNTECVGNDNTTEIWYDSSHINWKQLASSGTGIRPMFNILCYLCPTTQCAKIYQSLKATKCNS